MKTRCVPVLVVLMAAVFASSDLTGDIIVLDVPGAKDTSPYDINGNNVVGYFKFTDDADNAHGFLYNGDEIDGWAFEAACQIKQEETLKCYITD